MTACPAPASAAARYPRRGGAQRVLRLVASEGGPSYRLGGDAPSGDRVELLTGAVGSFLATSLDELDDGSIQSEVGALEGIRRRVEARIARATAVLADRQARRAADANPDDGIRAGERARRQVRDELADEHGWSKTQAKDNERLGRALDHSPTLGEAADEGDISSANAVKLGRFLARLSPEERAQVEDRLMEAARTQDPVTFGRTIEQIRAELSPADAEKAEQRRHANRRATLTTTSDGMTRVYAELGEVDGALVRRGFDAFRHHDPAGTYRSPEQRSADALVDLVRAALRDTGGDGHADEVAPGHGSHGPRPASEHGVRPHVVVTVPIDVLLANTGTVDLDGTEVPLAAVRHLMDDAGWSFVVTEAHNRPLAVTAEARTVTVALWRALQLRDGGCIVEGCDFPARWCDVMHLEVPHRDGGRLSLDNAGLGCRPHHRQYDQTDSLELFWTDEGRPVLRPRARRDEARAGP